MCLNISSEVLTGSAPRIMKKPFCLMLATALHFMIVSCTKMEEGIDTDFVYLTATKKETCLQSLDQVCSLAFLSVFHLHKAN